MKNINIEALNKEIKMAYQEVKYLNLAPAQLIAGMQDMMESEFEMIINKDLIFQGILIAVLEDVK